MTTPKLDELPVVERVGWPWTAESTQLPLTMPNGAPWPNVTIVTPSYNQAPFLEETIRSVLLQRYPNLEYIIIDGGSTDGSVDLIRKYEPWLAYWVSEEDPGQSHAINKGLQRASGAYVAWLNSDDRYRPDALVAAVRALEENPAAGMVHGHHTFIDESGSHMCDTTRDEAKPMFDRTRLLNERDFINQPTVLMRRKALQQVGLLDTALHYAMDYDLWLRLSAAFPVAFIDRLQADYRLHMQAKTTVMPYALAQERYALSRKHGGDGIGIALRTLELRWRQIAAATALEGPRALLDDASSEAFKHLPPDAQNASTPVLITALLDGAFICMRQPALQRATEWLTVIARLAPGRAINRGTIAAYLRALKLSYLKR